MALSPGDHLGPYEVLAPLGAGGMGEVYRARDPRLGREVALKVLPADRSHDPQRLTRFEEEARAVAALNHPHILSVFDIGTHDGTTYVVFELLEGRTLRRVLGQHVLPARKAVEYGIQICRGLAAAHEHGVVHRDLKPENLLLTREGQIKILDFGLAKLSGAADDDTGLGSEARTATEPGVVMGTAGYMSPEQARGQPADARSDVFALGAVLYEMLSGQRAFQGDTAADTLSAILHKDPPAITESRAGPVPSGLERVVRRCLEKHPQERFQTTRDLAFALDALSGSSGVEAPTLTPPRKRWLLWGAALLAGAGAISFLMARLAEPPRPRTPLSVVPLTSDPAQEFCPTLSPDGRLMAFERFDPERQAVALYVRQVVGSEPFRIAEGALGGLAWSPDGSRIAFYRELPGGESSGGAIFAVPALGGPEERLATVYDVGRGDLSQPRDVDWSPDGQFLAVTDTDTLGEPAGIFLVSLRTGEKRRLTRPPPGFLVGDSAPRFSPNGRTVAFVRALIAAREDIHLVSVEGGDVRRLTFGNLLTAGLDWVPDGKSLVFGAPLASRGVAAGLWRISASGGEPVSLGVGEGGWQPSVSRQGNRLVYSKREWVLDIWRVGGPTARAEEKAPVRLIASQERDAVPQYSPDGGRILFASMRSGFGEIWVADTEGKSPRQVTNMRDPGNWVASWSPDGRRIAFSSARQEGEGLYVMSASGGAPRRVVGSSWPWIADYPSWSRDGRWLYHWSNRSGRGEIWKVPVEGGTAVQVTRKGGMYARESPDGLHLYFTRSGPEGGPLGLWRMPRDGGEEERVLEGVFGLDWDLFEQGICFVDHASDAGSTIDYYDFAAARVSRAAELDPQFLFGFGISVSPDGRFIVYTRDERPESDIMLVENFR